MKKNYLVLLLILLNILSQETMGDGLDKSPLTLIKTYPVEGSEYLDLSGLDLCKGELYTVSDKKNGIFRVKLDKTTATLTPYLEISDVPSPPLESGKRSPINYILSFFATPYWDWEGISCSPSTGFYLVSEEVAEVLHVSFAGKMRWISGNLYNTGKKAGFFQKKNAFLEGITHLSDQNILVAVEREPRGLIKLNLNDFEVINSPIKVKPHPKPHLNNRNVDFSGLDTLNGLLYTLERNAQMVCKRDLKSFEVVDCKEFGWIENSKVYRYKKMRYGHAEGLAVNQSRIYIILDNNGSKREKGKSDRRSLLFEFEFPKSWLP